MPKRGDYSESRFRWQAKQADHDRRRIAAITYKDKPWAQIENGYFVGELPPEFQSRSSSRNG